MSGHAEGTAGDQACDVWKYALGRRPHKVVIVEREDRGGALQIRYSIDGKHPRPFLRPPHPQTVRGRNKRGIECIDSVAEAQLHALAAQVRELLLRGIDPMALIDPPIATPVPSPASAPTPTTLRQLIEVAAPDVRDSGRTTTQGVYGVNSADAREFRQLALKGVLALEHVLRARGELLVCNAVRPGDWMSAGRWLLDQFTPTPGRLGSGLRTTQRALGAVIRCANWAMMEGACDVDALAKPSPKWRGALTGYLARADAKPTVVRKPRLTEEAAGRFLALVYDLEAELDERFRLLMVLGFPLRLGQVAQRLYRSQVALDDSGVFGAGRVTVPKIGTKPSASFDLHPEERVMLDLYLAEPMRKLESAFLGNSLDDYPLFPGGRFRNGVMSFKLGQARPKPIGQRQLLAWYRQAESWVGLPYVRSGGWYALRRTCADTASQVTNDAEVKNALGGWEPEGTRSRVYRDRQDPNLLAAVAEARAAIRTLLRSKAPTPAAHTTRDRPKLVTRDAAPRGRQEVKPSSGRTRTRRGAPSTPNRVASHGAESPA